MDEPGPKVGRRFLRILSWVVEHWASLAAIYALVHPGLIWLRKGSVPTWIYVVCASLFTAWAAPFIDRTIRRLGRRYLRRRPDRLLHLLNHTASDATKLVSQSYMISIIHVQEEYQKIAGVAFDHKAWSIMNTWWHGTLQSELRHAAQSGEPEAWQRAVSHLSDFNLQLHDTWKDAIAATRNTEVTRGWLAVYSETIGTVESEVRLLNSNGWNFEWIWRSVF